MTTSTDVPPALSQAEVGIVSVKLEQLFPGIEEVSVKIGAIDPDTGHANHVDMLYVVAMARHLKARAMFEFGTYLGRTTRHLAEGAPDGRVYTLDLDPQGPKPPKLGGAISAVLDRGLQGHFYRASQAAERVVQLHGDSRTFDYRPLLGSMDFIFVDASHYYEPVKNDTEQALKLLRPGGTIVWHDYAEKTPEVIQALTELGERLPLFHIQKTSLVVYVDGLRRDQVSMLEPAHSRRMLKG